MNEQVVQDLYDRAVSLGYKKSKEDFINLLHTNSDVQNDNYSYVKSKGYQKSINEFLKLTGASAQSAPQPEAQPQEPLKKKEQSATTGSPSAGSSLASQSQSKPAQPSPQEQPAKEPEEKDYFTGAFGDVLRAYDKMVPLGIGDFIDDLARSVSSGYSQGELSQAGSSTMFKGAQASPEQIQKLIEAGKNIKDLGQSQEFQNFNKIYEEEGGGVWGTVKGLILNPTALADVIVNSAVSLATNTDALMTGAAAIGTGASAGAGIGAVGGAGVGAVPGAIAGATTAVPYAYGLANAMVEMGSSFAEGITDELQGKEPTIENVRAILEDPDKLQSIRNRAIARGAIIGTVDAFTGKLATKVGAKILGSSAAKSATGEATRRAVVGATAAGAGVEAVGGSTGEAAARAATGQKMDTAEILLEGIAELPGGIRSTIMAKYSNPVYKVNGQKVSAEDVDTLIQTMSPEQLQKTKIDISNDYEGRKEKIQDKIITHAIKQEVKTANPDLNEPSLNAITDLEKQLKKLEGNTTQTGKDKAAAIRAEIKNIQENQLEEEVAAEITPEQKKSVIVADIIKVAPTQVRSDEDIANDIKEELASNEETKRWSIDNEEGDYVPLTGNEDLFAQRVVEALSITPSQRTYDQAKAIDLADRILGPRLLELSNKKSDLSWANNLQSDKIYNLFFDNEESIPAELAPMARETNDDGSVFVKAKGEDVKKALGMEAVKQLDNNESVTFTFDSLDQVPEPFREEAEQRAFTIEGREKVLGLPVGKKTSKTMYRVTMTGAEAKKYNVRAPRAVTKTDIAKNVSKSLTTIFPDLKVMNFANAQEMKQYVQDNFGPEMADSFQGNEHGTMLTDDQGKPSYILINDESGDSATLPHEVWHGILIKAFGEDPELFAQFRDSIIKTLKKNGYNDIVKQLDIFSNDPSYIESNTQAEEWLVEFGGLLTSAGISMNNMSPKAKTLLGQIKDILNQFAVKITGQPIFLEDATPEDILDFMITISDSMARGEDLSKFFREGAGRASSAGMRAQRSSTVEKGKVKFRRELPEGLEIVDGWYSPIEKRLRETKVEKQSANKWLTGGVIGKGDEAIYTGVKGWLESKNPQEQVSKKDILDWMSANRVDIVEVVKTKKGGLTNDELIEMDRIFTRMTDIKMEAEKNSFNESGRFSDSKYLNLLLENDEFNELEKRYQDLKFRSIVKDDTKFSKYKLPGESSNYKEILVTLPSTNPIIISRAPSFDTMNYARNTYGLNSSEYQSMKRNVMDELEEGFGIEYAKIKSLFDHYESRSNEYQSRHFDETNILVHLRTDIRTDADGNKVLFLEEVQSDWGQEGKKEGFVNMSESEYRDLREEYNEVHSRLKKPLSEEFKRNLKIVRDAGLVKDGDKGVWFKPETETDMSTKENTVDVNTLPENIKTSIKFLDDSAKSLKSLSDKADALKLKLESASPNGTPKGPFVTNTNAWVKLGLKIALREAEKNGIDTIAWTTGEQQNERYDLSKQVDQINVEGVDGNVHLVDIKLSDGTTENLEVENGIIRDGSGVGQRLDSVIGKEYADKVLSTPSGESVTLEGQDLKMGGSGMKGFYDKIVPDVFKSLMKEITGNDTAIETVVINGNEQSAISVTPEAKAQVKVGVAKFRRSSNEDLQEIKKIAQRYNINVNGFGPKQASEQALSRELARFGYSARRAKPTPEGHGGGIYIVGPNGKFFNPNKIKFRRINLGAGSQDLSSIPGYDTMLQEANRVAERTANRGASYDRIMEAVMQYVMQSKVYQDANDSQREQLVRNVRAEFGKREKSAPSVGKILVDLFKKLPDPKKITISEKELLKQHIRDLARGARDAKKAFMDASADLADAVSELASTGKITPKQVTAIINRFSKVNMFNEDSVNTFVDYMAKVFQDAEYAEKISGIRSKLSKANENLKRKVGIADSAMPSLRRFFAINPLLIPIDMLDNYVKIVDMFSASGAVLPLEDINQVTQEADAILDEINNEFSKAEELALRFDAYDDKKVDQNTGKVEFAETVNKMVREGIITQEDGDLMKKYKSTVFPKEPSAQKTEAEIQQEKDVLISVIRSTSVNVDRLPTKDERVLADSLRRLLKPDMLNRMSIAELNNIIKLIDNINNGYMPHYGELTVERLNAKQNGDILGDAVSQANPLTITQIYNNLKSKFTKKNGVFEMVRGNPLFFIDQVFGNFKTKPIFESLFKTLSENHAAYTSAIGKVNKKLDKAHDAVAKSFKFDANKTLESSFRMMAYMIQLEYESNPGSSQVNPASEYIKATIKKIKESGAGLYGKPEIEMLQRILDENGNVDKDKLYASFNKAEKKAIDTIREVNDSLTEKAVFTAAVIRGQRIDPLVNYVHLPVMADYNPDENFTASQNMNSYNAAMQPSSKAKNLLERTPGAKAINFDVFASAQKGAKSTLLDYYLTSPIRTSRKAINEARSKYFDQYTDQQIEIFNAINNGFEEAISNVLTNSFLSDTFADRLANAISKQGYRAILASSYRFIAELISNIGFVIVKGQKSFIKGLKYFNIYSDEKGVNVMENVASKNTSRIYHGDTLSGRFIDQSILGQASGVKSTSAKGVIANKANQIYNLSLKKYKNGIELIADTLISTPDKMIMRPVWFGEFASEFKKLTGTDVDFDKIAENDEQYMRLYKEEIAKSRDKADEMSVLAGATDNPFMGMLKGTSKPNENTWKKLFNNFNTFMTKFAMYEYVSARQGIYAAMGNGSISRTEGIRLLAAVTTRMTVYTMLMNVLGSTLVGLLGDDDEEDDDKTIMQKLGQAFASSATGLIVGRNFGNVTKTMLNYGVEYANEEFLTALRNGDYNAYEDAISYSAIPKEDAPVEDFIKNMSGAYSPAIKTFMMAYKNYNSKEKKEPEAIKRQQEERSVRIPLEVLGNIGMIPLYKDVRKVVTSNIYKDLRHAEKHAEDKKQAEKEMLHGYENREDMKRYDPELYDRVFGKDSPGYDADQAKKKLKREADRLEREMKDEFYEYVPKKKEKKGSFGSAKFGSAKFGSGGK